MAIDDKLIEYKETLMDTKELLREVLTTLTGGSNKEFAENCSRTYFFLPANLLLCRKKSGRLEYGLTGKPGFTAVIDKDASKSPWGYISLPEQKVAKLDELGDTLWFSPAKAGFRNYGISASELIAQLVINTGDYWATSLSAEGKNVAQKLFGSMEKVNDKFGNLRSEYGKNMDLMAFLGTEYLKINIVAQPIAWALLKEIPENQVIAFMTQMTWDRGYRFSLVCENNPFKKYELERFGTLRQLQR